MLPLTGRCLLDAPWSAALLGVAHAVLPLGYFHERLAMVVAPARLSFTVAHLGVPSENGI